MYLYIFACNFLKGHVTCHRENSKLTAVKFSMINNNEVNNKLILKKSH